MPSVSHRLKIVIAAFCGVAYLTAIPLLSPAMVMSLTHLGHEVRVLNHDGHEDVVLHHEEGGHSEEADADGEDLAAHFAHHSGHDQHHDHVFCLSKTASSAPSARALALGVGMLQVVAIVELPDFHAGWRLLESPLRARPPPPCSGGALACLRTTMLMV